MNRNCGFVKKFNNKMMGKMVANIKVFSVRNSLAYEPQKRHQNLEKALMVRILMSIKSFIP